MRIGSKLLLAWMMLFLSVLSFAQGGDLPVISGIVKDGSDSLMQSITVTEKGTRNMVVTNDKGVFTIRIKSANAILVFTSVGFETQEVKVGTQKSIDVVMTRAVAQQDEVVIMF